MNVPGVQEIFHPAKLDNQGSHYETQMPLTPEEAARGCQKKFAIDIPGENWLGLPKKKTKKYNVKIPPATQEGTIIKLSAQGAASTQGGPAGDLLLKIKINTWVYN